MARPLIGIPILRKDFIIDEYQLLQARIVGADAVLLIAACLTQEECATLTARAHALGLEVLLEIHTFSELAYVNADVDMVGVNNRNLGTFVTDVKNSFHITENSGRYRPQPWILPTAKACRYLFRKAEFHIPKPFAGCALQASAASLSEKPL